MARYNFRRDKRALVLIFTSCDNELGYWRADPGHKSDELKIKAKFEALGFRIVEHVSLQGNLPTEVTIRECIARLANTDFGWCDGVFVVIAAHGKEVRPLHSPVSCASANPQSIHVPVARLSQGGFYAGPTSAEPNRASGPVAVRDICLLYTSPSPRDS